MSSFNFGEFNLVGQGSDASDPLFAIAKSVAAGSAAGAAIAGSINTTVANSWVIGKALTVPVGKVLYPLSVEMASATANYQTAVRRRLKLGTINLGSGVFTASGFSAPIGSCFESMYAIVTTVLSNATNTLTVTYKDQDDASSIAAAVTLTNTAVGTRTIIPLLGADVGVLSVTNATEAGTATGVVDIYGEVTLAYARHGVANVINDYRFPHPENFQILENEELTLELQHTATTATQRDIYFKYALRDKAS